MTSFKNDLVDIGSISTIPIPLNWLLLQVIVGPAEEIEVVNVLLIIFSYAQIT